MDSLVHKELDYHTGWKFIQSNFRKCSIILIKFVSRIIPLYPEQQTEVCFSFSPVTLLEHYFKEHQFYQNDIELFKVRYSYQTSLLRIIDFDIPKIASGQQFLQINFAFLIHIKQTFIFNNC